MEKEAIGQSPAKSASIEAMIKRGVDPIEGDKRPWQPVQCMHCQQITWILPQGIISYWHRNPFKRLWWWLRRTQ